MRRLWWIPWALLVAPTFILVWIAYVLAVAVCYCEARASHRRRYAPLWHAALVAGAALIAGSIQGSLYAHDNGQFAASNLKPWFDKLASGKGLCCSFADGFKIDDVDWDTQGGSYRVRIKGQWIVVPDNAVVTEPNKYGPAVVWPYQDAAGVTQIRCFIPGSGA